MEKNKIIDLIKESREERKLIKHFKAVSKGKWDNIEWNKGDVGEVSKTFTDRHNFKSVAIRFKGAKSSKTIPEVVFRKHFKVTAEAEVNSQKWANADKGGTKIKVKPRKKKDILSADEIKKEVKSSLKLGSEPNEKTLGKTTKEELEMSNENLQENSEIIMEASGDISIMVKPDALKKTWTVYRMRELGVEGQYTKAKIFSSSDRQQAIKRAEEERQKLRGNSGGSAPKTESKKEEKKDLEEGPSPLAQTQSKEINRLTMQKDALHKKIQSNMGNEVIKRDARAQIAKINLEIAKLKAKRKMS